MIVPLPAQKSKEENRMNKEIIMQAMQRMSAPALEKLFAFTEAGERGDADGMAKSFSGMSTEEKQEVLAALRLAFTQA